MASGESGRHSQANALHAPKSSRRLRSAALHIFFTSDKRCDEAVKMSLSAWQVATTVHAGRCDQNAELLSNDKTTRSQKEHVAI